VWRAEAFREEHIVRRRRFLGAMAAGMVGAWAGVGGAAPPPVGKAAPEFSVILMDGRTVALKDFRGNPVLVNYWASG
jgi:cytochrome oxidase Cu insertion factor (SCO1/SenC/PrrC family)